MTADVSLLRPLARVARGVVTAALVVVACHPAAAAVASGSTAAERQTQAALRAAVRLLPRQPSLIAVMDVTACRPGVREHMLTLDAFVVRGNGAIYVVQQSEVLRRAESGDRLYIGMLATILWHEMAHLAGADERGARRAEEELWTTLLRDGIADPIVGLRYLRALNSRPDDQLPSLQ